MFTLTLSKSERRAIDFVNYRYWNGHCLYSCLWRDSKYDGELDWDSEGDITFCIPRDTATRIVAHWEDDDKQIPLFADELKHKIQSLIYKIREEAIKSLGGR